LERVPSSPPGLLTGRFIVMCGFTFTVFLSLFQLLPVAPYRILALGGSTGEAGLFLGFLTYASASSAPFTGALVDRLGQRHVLIAASLILTGFSVAYTFVGSYHVLLALVLAHGVFWSGLLAASGAYMTSTVPPTRRAEGLGYWGLMSAGAIGVAPAVGFLVYRFGWAALCAEMIALNLAMALIAWRLPPDHARPDHALSTPPAAGPSNHKSPIANHKWIDVRVLRLSLTLSLVSFGYGSLTTFSALFMDALHLAPRSLFLTVMAAALVASRLLAGRRLDEFGHRRVLLPCLFTAAVGLVLMATAASALGVALAAVVFGAGFGLMYPTFTAYLMGHVHDRRRGAAYGAMLAAFDGGIATGSTTLGWLIAGLGFRAAFGITAAVAFLAVPYFLLADRFTWRAVPR
jgi:MFS family permease